MTIALRILMMMFLVAIGITLPAQCPSSDSFYRRIIQVINAPSLSENDRLSQLLICNEQISKCPPRNDSTHTYLLRRIGVVYKNLSDYNHAIEYTKKAIDLIRANINSPSIVVGQLANCYYNLQTYYDSLNEDVLRREAADSCIAVDLRIGGNYYYSSSLLNDKVTYLFNKGDYVLCLKWSELSEKILTENYPDSIRAIWYAIIYHVNALVSMKEYDEAQKYLVPRIGSPSLKLSPDSLGSIYMSLGIINRYKESYKQALSYFQKAAVVNKKINYKIGYVEALLWMGFIYSDKLNDYKNGMNAFKKALAQSDDIDAIVILDEMATVYVKKNLFDSAYFFFQKAFDKIKPGATEKDLIELAATEAMQGKAMEYFARLLSDKGNAFLKQYQIGKDRNALAKAVEVYKLADQLLTRIKTMHLDATTKLYWRANTRSLYEEAIEASYLLGDMESSFYFFERSRAVLLGDQLSEQNWIAEKDIVKRAKLESDIALNEKELAVVNKSSTRYNELDRGIFEKRQELEKLQGIIKANNPLYYQNYVDKNFITLKDVNRNLLKDHQALIEIFSGDSAVYLFLVTSQQNILRKIDKKLFDSLSKSFSRYVSSIELLNTVFSKFITVSSQLYQLIFGNIDLPKGRIIISPDGQYFPFEALITNPQSNYYFISDHAVSYTYSARWLMNEFSGKPISAAKTFLGVAPVKFNNGFPSLYGSDVSLKGIEDYFAQTTLLIGANASKKNFVDQFADFRIIQLYTHGEARGSEGEPVIYFCDSSLAMSELFYGKRPATSLVVLAACETGLGDLHPGEGVFSFNRAFAALGIPSAVSNLWQVDNKSTYKLTELFYKNVANGLPLDVSLQKAKLEYLSKSGLENGLPYYWAAPVLVGQTNKISTEKSEWQWMGVVLVLMLISIWLAMRQFRHYI
jgi:CHAT domain-containing protein